jgi:hypothetical protein
MKQAIKDDIQSRTDVSFLVNSFYNKVKADQLLGPIFMKMIPVDKWNDHLIRLSDFWETALFGVVNLKGILLLRIEKLIRRIIMKLNKSILDVGSIYGFQRLMNILKETKQIERRMVQGEWQLDNTLQFGIVVKKISDKFKRE